MPWIPGAEHFHNPPPMAPEFHQMVELEFGVADALRRPGLPRQRAGDAVTIQLKFRPRVQKGADASFEQSEQRGTIRMEDVASVR